ncbi:MAG: dihydrolipoamide acetyltransferase family protein [Bacteroidota bacterium]
MAEVIRMPKMSDTMETGVIATWLKHVGDAVQVGDILAEVETDKATMDLEAYQEGVLLHVGAKAGDTVPVDGILAIIGQEGEDINELLTQTTPTQAPADVLSTSVAVPEQTNPAAPSPMPSGQSGTATPQRLLISPMARKMAQEKGIDVSQVTGTGPGGRIVKRDVAAFVTSTTIVTPDSGQNLGEEAHREVPISQMRKTIAHRLIASKTQAPHFYLTAQVDMDNFMAAKANINAWTETKISLNDMILKVVAVALRRHPQVNAAWLDNTIRYHQHVHLGVAVAVEDGLLVPVLRFADQQSLVEIATKVSDFVTKARNNQLQPSDYAGHTFTVSNLGMLGVESFTAIINPPAACTLAVGQVKQVPLVKEGAVVPGYAMKLTLSCDHRVVDGAVGAAFLQTVQALLADPLRLLVY